MKDTPYFCFIVIADPQPWPYYVEIPYTAWPDEGLYFNSNGNCQQVYDREWSYLDVMSWETHENLVVWNAREFSLTVVNQTRLRMEEAISWGDDLLSPAPIGRLGLYLLDTIPNEYCEPGNVVIASFQCHRPELSAAVARLFMRRLKSDVVWDAQTRSPISLSQLLSYYLEGFPLKEGNALADEARYLFTKIEVWHDTHPSHQIGWLKTLAQARVFLVSKSHTGEGGA